MKCKRILAGLLAAALLMSLMLLPVSAAGSSAFTDIQDPDVAEAAEILRLLDVVDGTGGSYFRPSGTLSRAEFCKMAVCIMGKRDLEPAQRGRTIFTDVGPGHWARGYVNLASSLTTSGELAGAASSNEEGGSAGDRLILGVGDGSFEPNRAITFGEAVAILIRILGYSSADIAPGAAWYDGYLSLAKESGLSDGLNLAGNATITRGQTAQLFRNLLFTNSKGTEECYLVGKLGGSLTEDVTLLAMEHSSTTGTNSVTLASGSDILSPRTGRTGISSDLLGVRGQMAQDKDGKFLTLRPNSDDLIRRVSISGTVDANYITAGGEKITVLPETVVWKNGEATTFEKEWSYLYTGTPMVLCYGPTGKLDYIYLSSASQASDEVMVARSDPNGSNPFTALLHGASDYKIYKNGVPATVSDLRRYDVAYYDSAAKILYVSDQRLTGRYENAYPNPTAPSKVTMLSQEFTVLAGAAGDLAAFRPGDNMTLLFTSDGRVAGAVDASEAKSTTVGVVQKCENGTAEVSPLVDMVNAAGEKVVFQGQTTLSDTASAEMVGQLVTVSSNSAGKLTLTKLTKGETVEGSLDVENRMLDGVALSPNVRLFERVGRGPTAEIQFDQLTRSTVPASKILYAAKDYSGKYSVLVFDDVTGDQYEYGFAQYRPADPPTGEVQTNNPHVAVRNVTTSSELVCGTQFRKNELIGIASSLETLNGEYKLGRYVRLTRADGVIRSDYDPDNHTLRVGEETFPISKEVWCYNETTGHWFEGEDGYTRFELARAYAQEMTVYYDNSPQNGGKIRFVVVK